MIRILQYTVEGDPFYTDVIYYCENLNAPNRLCFTALTVEKNIWEDALPVIEAIMDQESQEID